MGILDGKTAVITGAGQGVGEGIAFALASEGANIVVGGRTAAKLTSTVEEIGRRGAKAVAVAADVGDEDAPQRIVAAALEAFGGIDILVNNAQVVPLGSLLEVPEDSFEAGWRTGPFAAWRLMRACHPHLRDGGGVVVNLASSAGLRPDPQGYGCYGAVKEAMRSLSRAAAMEWGPDGIRVHVIAPLAESPGMAGWKAARPEEYAEFAASVPLGRVGDCEQDIGRVVVFLCGPDSSYMTGGTYLLDGGQMHLR